jgi:dihydrofolate reductase
VTGT